MNPAPERAWTDERVEVLMGRLLRAGVVLAASVVAAGALFFLVRHGGEPFDYGVFRGEPSDLRHVGSILRESSLLRARAMIQTGLLVLIATPIARLLFAAVAFHLQRDRVYVGITLFVLTVLLYSLSGAGF